MKIQIAKHTHYQLFIDEQKQRLYVKLNGFWNKEHIYISYLQDLYLATAHFVGSFDCHADFSGFKAMTEEHFINYHFKALKFLRNKGLKRSGQIMPDDPLASKQLVNIIEQFTKPIMFGESDLVELYLDTSTPSFTYNTTYIHKSIN